MTPFVKIFTRYLWATSKSELGINKKTSNPLIGIGDKMFITKDINSATVAYFKKIVLRKLLIAFSFQPQSNNEAITDLLKSVNHYGFDLPSELELDLYGMLMKFKNDLEKDELTALYFWGLDQKYMCYFENFLNESDTYSEKEFDGEFGRSLAYKVYEPNASGLEEDTIEELKALLCDFAGEFDLSIVDEHTCKDILETMETYCLAAN
ncbi:hypothetical protein PY092_00250 [Muricauda sp. 334s03]|nr:MULTISPECIES: hypothetical protein [Allomuricauda]MDF0714562.1 hypothetical protein [[Muricauda] yonaguniensis]TXK07069.1 hypothetical protein FQ019_03685 [Allomuricauda aequoris]